MLIGSSNSILEIGEVIISLRKLNRVMIIYRYYDAHIMQILSFLDLILFLDNA